MMLAYPEKLEADGGLTGGYEQYRNTRANMLQAYCLVLLSEHRELDTAVGVSFDAPFGRGGSEDLIVLHVDNWTDEMIVDANKAKEDFDILRRADRLNFSDFHTTNYPDRDETTPKLRRHRKRRGKSNPFKR